MGETEHTLKTLAPYWDAIASGAKTFEVRRDDRGFQKGDILVLRKMCTEMPHHYDSHYPNGTHEYWEIRKRITYVLSGGQFGIEPGYIVMGLADVS